MLRNGTLTPHFQVYEDSEQLPVIHWHDIPFRFRVESESDEVI